MNSNLITILGIIGIIHFFLALFTTIELWEFPLIKFIKKILWLVVIWLIPIIGVILFRNKYSIGWASGSSGINESATGGFNRQDNGNSED